MRVRIKNIYTCSSWAIPIFLYFYGDYCFCSFWLLYIHCSIIVVQSGSTINSFWMYLLFFVTRCSPRTCSWCVIQQHMHIVHSIFPAEKRVACSYAQDQVRNAHPHKISWLLAAVSNATLNYYRVTALGWLKKEERKKTMNNSGFRLFQV